MLDKDIDVFIAQDKKNPLNFEITFGKSLWIQPGSPSEITFIRQWVRDTGRDFLQLIPDNSMTSAAQMMLGVQDQPISYIKGLLKTFTKDRLDYIISNTYPSVSGLQERAI